MSEAFSELEAVLAEHVQKDMLPPVYTEHPVAVASGMKAQPIEIYIDGVPTTKKDGVLGIWVRFVLSKK